MRRNYAAERERIKRPPRRRMIFAKKKCRRGMTTPAPQDETAIN